MSNFFGNLTLIEGSSIFVLANSISRYIEIQGDSSPIGYTNPDMIRLLNLTKDTLDAIKKIEFTWKFCLFGVDSKPCEFHKDFVMKRV